VAITPLSKESTLLARVLSLNQRQAAPIDSAIRAINRVAINRHQSQSVAISRTWSTRRSQSVAISRNQSHLVHEALVQWGALDETRRLGRPVGVMTLVHLMTQRQSELNQSSIRGHQAQGGRG
jgi:hypothetical protein